MSNKCECESSVYNCRCLSHVIKILNLTEYIITFEDANSNKLRDSKDSIGYGICDAEARTICVANNLSDERTEQILRHEIFHAIMRETTPVNSYYSRQYDEEEVADMFARYGEYVYTSAHNIVYK